MSLASCHHLSRPTALAAPTATMTASGILLVTERIFENVVSSIARADFTVSGVMTFVENALGKQRPFDERQIGTRSVLLSLGNDMIPIGHLLDHGPHRPAQPPRHLDAPMAKYGLVAARTLRMRSDQDRGVLTSVADRFDSNS